jgi:hypothetical protein
MTRGVRKYLVSSVVLVALIGVAGCSHFLFAQREPWRRDAELACLNSGAVPESAARVRITAINGPGMCGMDYPIKVSALGDVDAADPLNYDDDPPRPPGSVPGGTVPSHWPGVSSSALPPPVAAQPAPYNAPPPVQPSYRPPQYGAPEPQVAPQRVAAPASQVAPQRVAAPAPQVAPQRVGAPLSLWPPGMAPPDDDDEYAPTPEPYGAPRPTAPPYMSRPPVPPSGNAEPLPRLGPERTPLTAAVPVGVKPPATLACPIVSALDQWINGAVQPAALKWFRQPVVEIKQISAYSCRGMNGNPNAHISEHAFGNALDVAEFDLADGRKVSVQYGWHGTPEEQGFLHDVQSAACDQFTTVLAPGANVYHYNHIHVDLMRHASGRHICEPSAIPGEVVAERARGHFAAQHSVEAGTTGSIVAHRHRPALSYSGEDDDRLPLAVPGDD